MMMMMPFNCSYRNKNVLGCGLLGAVVLPQEVPMQSLERAEGGGILCGGVLEVVAWQPDLGMCNYGGLIDTLFTDVEGVA